jgi:hypothetical protein
MVCFNSILFSTSSYRLLHSDVYRLFGIDIHREPNIVHLDCFMRDASLFTQLDGLICITVFQLRISTLIIFFLIQNLCDSRGCTNGILNHGSFYQFLTMTPYIDRVPWTYGSRALVSTTANFTGEKNKDCTLAVWLQFVYRIHLVENQYMVVFNSMFICFFFFFSFSAFL